MDAQGQEPEKPGCFERITYHKLYSVPDAADTYGAEARYVCLGITWVTEILHPGGHRNRGRYARVYRLVNRMQSAFGEPSTDEAGIVDANLDPVHCVL